MKEKLQQYALISEIIGGIGIIASLIFVGVQVNQSADETAINTKQMQAEAYLELRSSITDINRLIIEQPDLQGIISKVNAGENVSEGDLSRASAWYRILFSFGDMAWMQYEKGMITEDELGVAIGIVRANMSPKFAQVVWERTSLSTGFRNYINEFPIPTGEPGRISADLLQ